MKILLKLYYMTNGEDNMKSVEKEFKKLTKDKFPSPETCTQLNQTQAVIFELTKIIRHFESKFNCVPPSAQLLITEYCNKQDKMIFDIYKKEFCQD
ncbi:MAG: hypothetical protein U5K79_10360 [Cyclobacteriaceae bacterium]|nr:hypothetical protein [Cyclobacteriaceae bacterium]